MKNLMKSAIALAVLAPSLSFAQTLNTLTQTEIGTDNTAAATGNVIIEGDSEANGGGTGWVNADNDVNIAYNELDVDYTTAGEVYVSAETNHAMAVVKAIHLGGKGAIYVLTTAGFTGQCAEDVRLIEGADGNIEPVFSYGGVTGTFTTDNSLPENITPNTPNDEYVVASCEPLGSS